MLVKRKSKTTLPTQANEGGALGAMRLGLQNIATILPCPPHGAKLFSEAR